MQNCCKKKQFKLIDQKQKIEEEISLCNRKISSELFSKSQLRYTAELDKLRKEIAQSTSNETLYQSFLKSGLSVTQNLTQLYLKGTPGQKKDILGSIFPEKIQIDEKNCRTAKVNEALALILATDKDYKKIKTGQLFKNIELSGYVEATGIEPVSKHILQKLSTCLFPH